MTRTVEATGRNIEEATRSALVKLGVARDEAEIEVVESGKSGFLWFRRSSPAKVRATTKIADRDRVEDIVHTILRLMTFNSQLHISGDKDSMVIDIETAGADGLLIGKAGHTLSSMEYLINRMLQREGRRTPRVLLDVSGYKRRREDFLKAKALSLAKQVKSGKQKVTMEPLESADRRIVHSVLKEDPEIATESVGHGSVKSIVVSPAKGTGRSLPRGRRRGRRKQPGRSSSK